MRMAGQGAPKPKVKIKVRPKAKSYTPPDTHDVGITKQPTRRGHAPTVFQEKVGARTPTQKMQAKQQRKTARSVLNLRKAESGYVEQNYGPRYVVKSVPSRPLTSKEVAGALGKGKQTPVSSVRRTMRREEGKGVRQIVKPKKGKGFNLTAVGGDIPKELAGSGALEKAITNVGAASGKGWQMALGKVGLPGVGKAIGNIPKDTANIVSSTVPSVYLPARALVQRKPGKALGMVTGGIKETVKHPGEHPVSLLLLARGAEGAVSRTAGGAARSGALGKGAKEYASTERLPLALGGAAFEQRHASKGLIENRAQKALDRRAAKKGRQVTVNIPERDAHGALIKNRYTKAIKPDPRREELPHFLGGKKVLRRADTEHGASVQTTRTTRDRAVLALDRVKPRHGADAAYYVNRGVIKSPKTVKADLEKYRTDLERERAGLKEPADLAENEANIAQVTALLKNEKFLARPERAFHAARVYAEVHKPLEAERVKNGDLTKGQAERRPLLDFAVREMGLRHNEKAGRFETPDGKTVSNAEIVKAFERAGGDASHLAFVPLRSDFVGARNFGGSPIRRPGAETKTFTGQSALKGTHQAGFHVLREQLAHAAVKVGRHDAVTRFVNTWGLRQSSGRYFDDASAQKEIRNQKAIFDKTNGKEGGDYVAVSAGRQSIPESLREQFGHAELPHTFREAQPGDSHVVLVPREVWDRIHEHLAEKPFSNTGRATAARVTRSFRHTVLPLSPRWFVGNQAEAYLRMQMHELTPVQVALTIKAGKRIEQQVREMGGEKAVDRLRASTGTGHVGSQRVLDTHNPKAGKLGRLVDAWEQSSRDMKWNDPKRMLHLWGTYRDAVFELNQRAENNVYFYALGKEARREVQSMNGSVLSAMKLAGPAYADVAKGLLESNNIARYARAVDDIRGRYSNLSPSGRYFVTTYTPFAPWYGNALHFIFIALPTKHPVKAGLAGALVPGTQAERDKAGLPPWAKMQIPLGNGKYLAATHYTPFAISEEGLRGASSLVLPQISGVQRNLEGKTWYGGDLPKGASIGEVALNTALGSFLPTVKFAQTVLEGGQTGAPDSTIFHPKTKSGEKGTPKAGLMKAINPFRSQGGGSSQDLSQVKLAPIKSAGGNRFLQQAGGNRFLQPQGQNRFLTH